MEELLQNLLLNFEQTQRHVFHFLQKKFTHSKLTHADFEDAISIAFEKLLLDATKPQPTLTPCYCIFLEYPMDFFAEILRGYCMKSYPK